MDLRERIAAACDEGTDTRMEIAERFAVSESWVRRLLQRRRETGSLAPKPRGGGQPSAFDAAAADRLRQAVAAAPDATLQELARASTVACSTSAVDRALRRLGITRKKVGPGCGAGPAGREGGAGGLAGGVRRRRSLALGVPR
jgi:transposase